MVRGGRAIDYLGYCFTHTNVRMRKSIKQTFARKAKRITNPEKRRETLAAYWGWSKWGDCRHLWKKITDNDMSFADIGINGRIETKDGKKFFDTVRVSISDILNLPITVIDFESGIDTKHGAGRYVVRIKSGGVEKKFMTNSFTLKSMLDQARRQETEEGKTIFPIETRIVKKNTGGQYPDYTFE